MARRVDKKQIMLDRKESLLKELQYYEKRLDEARDAKQNASFYENDSSDSEQEFTIEISPSITELKLQQSMLRTCLQATEELTSVQVLQSEVCMMVEDPVFQGEPPIAEDGVWRDVTVECRVDLVPFSMSFYAHKPVRPFAPVSYRNLQATAVKVAHERELAKSVLSSVRTPSDAVEVFRSYGRAHRSRRCTLAKLADSFASQLYMEPLAEGGYLLKCANILEVSWTLQNKTSPVAPFQHRMKFDIEYMDETYIKSITQAHRQLCDPTIDTDERTLLMAKIIKTCLEAEVPTRQLHDTSDSETLKERRQTLNSEQEVPIANDRHIMAPPKYPPKRIKPKGKENVNDKKRPSEGISDSTKRARLDTDVSKPKNTKNVNNTDVINDNTKKSRSEDSSKAITDKATAELKNVKQNNKKDAKTANTEAKKSINVASIKDKSETNQKVAKVAAAKNGEVSKKDLENKESNTTDKLKEKDVGNESKAKKVAVKNNELTKKDLENKNAKLTNIGSANLKSKVVESKNPKSKDTESANLKSKERKKHESESAITKDIESKSTKSKDLESKKTKSKNLENKNANLKDLENKNLKSKDLESKDPKSKDTESANLKSKERINIESESAKSKDNESKSTKSKEVQSKLAKLKDIERKKIYNKDLYKKKIDKKSLDGKTVAVNKASKKINSNIPQKRFSSDGFKKNPLRISPRKPQSNSNTVQDSSKTSVNGKPKTVTNIPRLLKKPIPKPKT